MEAARLRDRPRTPGDCRFRPGALPFRSMGLLRPPRPSDRLRDHPLTPIRVGEGGLCLDTGEITGRRSRGA